MGLPTMSFPMALCGSKATRFCPSLRCIYTLDRHDACLPTPTWVYRLKKPRNCRPNFGHHLTPSVKKTFPAVNIRGGNFGRRTPKTLWLAPAPLNLLDTLEVRPYYRTSSMSLGPGQLEGCLFHGVDSMIPRHSPSRSAEERLRGGVR